MGSRVVRRELRDHGGTVHGGRALTRFTFRWATPSDIPLLTDHRHKMFTAIGHRTEEQIREHDSRFRRWARRTIGRGELRGLLVQDGQCELVASGCIWFREEQPRPETGKSRSAYILSMYTEPWARRHGIAAEIVRRLTDAARHEGYSRVSLHASTMARGLYSSLGFEPTNEMRVELGPKGREAGAREPALRAARSRPPPGPGRRRGRARTSHDGGERP